MYKSLPCEKIFIELIASFKLPSVMPHHTGWYELCLEPQNSGITKGVLVERVRRCHRGTRRRALRETSGEGAFVICRITSRRLLPANPFLIYKIRSISIGLKSCLINKSIRVHVVSNTWKTINPSNNKCCSCFESHQVGVGSTGESREYQTEFYARVRCEFL